MTLRSFATVSLLAGVQAMADIGLEQMTVTAYVQVAQHEHRDRSPHVSAEQNIKSS
jgi:hypothetical protein